MLWRRMLADATAIPTTGDWIFEPKLDGIRVVVTIDHDTIELRTRGGMDVTKSYPGIVAALKQQPVSTAVFDGEIVAITPAGLPSFELLQQRMKVPIRRDPHARFERRPDQLLISRGFQSL